jgi:hypothetical protein
MADVFEVGSPEWWRDRLFDRYEADYKSRSKDAALYDTQSISPEFPTAYSDVYKRLLKLSRTPWGRLVVDIVNERLSVKGFQVGESTENDSDLWVLFRQNRMNALQRQIHREALAVGTSYASVWNPDRAGAKIVFESAMSMVHETMPGEPHATAAAQKMWYDSHYGMVRATTYLPDSIYRWVSNKRVEEKAWRESFKSEFKNTWEVSEVIPNVTGMVPIVPFVVRPDWEGYGNSDLGDLHDTIGRIDHLMANTLLAVELGALRQKWASGLEIPVDPTTNQPIEPFKVALDRLWVSEDPETRFGSFDQTDVRPYLQGISDAIGQLSAVSRIPTLYFNQSDLSNPPSAASLEASETGLINKVYERQDRFAESWEQVASLATFFETGEQVDPADVHTLWNDPRTRSEAQTVDAATKLYSINVPWEAIMEFVGYSPTEIERLKSQRAADTFDRLLNAPLNAATGIEIPGQQAQAEEEDAEG